MSESIPLTYRQLNQSQQKLLNAIIDQITQFIYGAPIKPLILCVNAIADAIQGHDYQKLVESASATKDELTEKWIETVLYCSWGWRDWTDKYRLTEQEMVRCAVRAALTELAENKIAGGEFDTNFVVKSILDRREARAEDDLEQARRRADAWNQFKARGCS